LDDLYSLDIKDTNAHLLAGMGKYIGQEINELIKLWLSKN